VGEEGETADVGKEKKERERNALEFGLGWAPLFPLGSPLFRGYDVPVKPLGVQARLSQLYPVSEFQLGWEVAPSATFLGRSSILATSTTDYWINRATFWQVNANLVSRVTVKPDKWYWNLRLGGGMAFMDGYAGPVVNGYLEPQRFWMPEVTLGTSVSRVLGEHFFLDFGLGYSHVFDNRAANYLRAILAATWRF
jgi:hypothetical protein